MIRKYSDRERRGGNTDAQQRYYRAFQALKKMAKKRGYEPIHHRWVQDERYRSGPKELGRIEEFCRELGELENAGGSTQEERERHNVFWVFRQTDVSVGHITTATSAHTHHSKMCEDFDKRRMLSRQPAPHVPLTVCSTSSDSNGSGRSSRSNSRRNGKFGGPQLVA